MNFYVEGTGEYNNACNVIMVLRVQQIGYFGCKGGLIRGGAGEIVQPESFVVHCGEIIFVAIPFFCQKAAFSA